MITQNTCTDLSHLNTFGVECIAREFITFTEPEEVTILDKQGIFKGNCRLLGGGANTLFATPVFDGILLQMCGKALRWIIPGRTCEAQAGIVWDDLVCQLLEGGVVGIENLSGIPGHLGGCTAGNIGAYGAEIADFITSVNVYDTKNRCFRTIPRAEAEFAYRTSIFKHDDKTLFIILSVTFSFPDPKCYTPNLTYKALAERLDNETITPQVIRRAVLEMRNQKLPDPAVTGNAGSFFKNPIVDAGQAEKMFVALGKGPAFPTDNGRIKLSAGWILDRCGWKGFIGEGDAGVDARNALVLINRGNATGNDIRRLALSIMDDVKQKIGILLEPEVKIIY